MTSNNLDTRSRIEQEVSEIISNIMTNEHNPITGPEDKIMGNIDSMYIVELVVSIQERYGLMMISESNDISMLESLSTLAQWIAVNLDDEYER